MERVKVVPQMQMWERTFEQCVDVPVPTVEERIVQVGKGSPQEQISERIMDRTTVWSKWFAVEKHFLTLQWTSSRNIALASCIYNDVR